MHAVAVEIERASASGFSMDWGMNGAMMWIHMEFPTSFLRNFTSHGDVLMQFLVALEARGIRIGETESIRTRVRGGRAGVSWEGTAYGPVHEVMPGMIKALTGEGQDE